MLKSYFLGIPKNLQVFKIVLFQVSLVSELRKSGLLLGSPWFIRKYQMLLLNHVKGLIDGITELSVAKYISLNFSSKLCFRSAIMSQFTGTNLPRFNSIKAADFTSKFLVIFALQINENICKYPSVYSVS